MPVPGRIEFDTPHAAACNGAVAEHLFEREGTKKRLREAVEAVESRSCAEVVIAVRPYSASWLWVDVLVGAVLAYVSLLYTLFAPQVFGLMWIALIVPTLFVAGVFLSRAVPSLRFGLAGKERVTQAVLDCARARFVEIGVTATRERSGVLVMVSLSERRCVVVADLGVVARVPKEAWAKATERVEATIAEHGIDEAGLDALCAAITGLGDTLEEPMPVRDDDINELEDVA